jgi:formylglycine-generating enzyme required for sulfatase activity
VWCNAYSEATGKTPYYYVAGTTDFTDGTKVLRVSEADTTAAGSGKADTAVSPTSSVNGFRLPTEAQWEYAARGGVPSAGAPWTNKYAGTNVDGDLGDYAWYRDNAYNVGSSDPAYGTHEVKTRTANTGGLYDMTGNVFEWCWDIYSGTSRVYRGSAWAGSASSCTVAYRSFDTTKGEPFGRSIDCGFRVVCP